MKETILWLLPHMGVAALLGVLCGCIGTHIYIRKIADVTSGISHFMIGPIGVSYAIAGLIGVDANPLYLSLLAAAILVFIIPVDDRGQVRLSQEIAVFHSFGMALGFFIAFLLPGFINYESFLFGSLFTINTQTTVMVCVITAITVTAEILFYNRFKYLGVDDTYLMVKGIRVHVFHRIQLCLMCVSIIVVLQSIGILMLISIMIIPTSIIALFAKRYGLLLLWSIVLSLVFFVLSVIISYWANVQMSSFAALFMSIIYFLLRAVRRNHGVHA